MVVPPGIAPGLDKPRCGLPPPPSPSSATRSRVSRGRPRTKRIWSGQLLDRLSYFHLRAASLVAPRTPTRTRCCARAAFPAAPAAPAPGPAVSRRVAPARPRAVLGAGGQGPARTAARHLPLSVQPAPCPAACCVVSHAAEKRTSFGSSGFILSSDHCICEAGPRPRGTSWGRVRMARAGKTGMPEIRGLGRFCPFPCPSRCPGGAGEPGSSRVLLGGVGQPVQGTFGELCCPRERARPPVCQRRPQEAEGVLGTWRPRPPVPPRCSTHVGTSRSRGFRGAVGTSPVTTSSCLPRTLRPAVSLGVLGDPPLAGGMQGCSGWGNRGNVPSEAAPGPKTLHQGGTRAWSSKVQMVPRRPLQLCFRIWGENPG